MQGERCPDGKAIDRERGRAPSLGTMRVGEPPLAREGQSRLPAYAALAASMLIVGLCVTLGKIAAAHMPIVALAGVRCASAALALLPLAWHEAGGGRALGRAMVAIDRRDRIDLALQALFGVFAFTLLMLGGVRLTGATDAGLIAATMPLAILLLAWPMLGERPRGRAMIAAALGAAGIALVTFAGGADGPAGAGDAPARWLGNALVIAAVVAEALYALLAKRLSTRVRPATMALLLNLVGLALFAPLLALQPWGALLAGVPAWAWLVGVLYGVLTSAVALVLWYRGTRDVPGGTAGLFTALLPVGAIASAAVLLGEIMTARHAAGGAVILMALALGLWRGRSPAGGRGRTAREARPRA